MAADVQKSLGHSHVMAPEFRSQEGAWAVAHKLLHKASMRLRMEHFYTGSLAVTIRAASMGRVVSQCAAPLQG